MHVDSHPAGASRPGGEHPAALLGPSGRGQHLWLLPWLHVDVGGLAGHHEGLKDSYEWAIYLS